MSKLLRSLFLASPRKPRIRHVNKKWFLWNTQLVFHMHRYIILICNAFLYMYCSNLYILLHTYSFQFYVWYWVKYSVRDFETHALFNLQDYLVYNYSEVSCTNLVGNHQDIQISAKCWVITKTWPIEYSMPFTNMKHFMDLI